MKNLFKIEDELYIVDNTEDVNKDTKTCWCIDISCNELVLYQGVFPSYHYKHYKKIIMTTDKSINVLCSCSKDCGAKESGVQAIDDEFLEWCVKNPSCEWVEVEKGYLGMGGFCKSNEIISKDKIHYKIIIPKEEPKHETVEEDLLDTAIQIVGSNNVITIREFLIKHKWQQDKKLYSEEEVIAMLKSHKLYIISELRGLSKFKNEKEWFKQFKKK